MIMYILLYRSYVFLWFIVFHADLMILLQKTMVTALASDPSKAYDHDHHQVLDDHDGLDDPHERDHFRASKALKSSTPKAGISIIHIEKKKLFLIGLYSSKVLGSGVWQKDDPI